MGVFCSHPDFHHFAPERLSRVSAEYGFGVPLVHCIGMLLVGTRMLGGRKRPRRTVPVVGSVHTGRKGVPTVGKASRTRMRTRVRRRHVVRFPLRDCH